jgi:demethylmenaquinone methyltransferase / 2-methoxy-6-polyprenyl-1,4-benzoquinol methylase
MGVPSNDPRLNLVERFFSGTGPSYDAVVHYATFGIDGRWKQHILSQIPANATRILDLACGTGILSVEIARRFPAAEVIGVELREEYLALAREKQLAAGIENVSFHLSRAEDFSSDRPFDCVVSSYLAKYADLPRFATAAASWLKPEGTFIAHDFTLPPGRLLRGLFRLYFFLLQTIGAPLLPTWREIFYGLPRLIEQTRWVQELPEELQKNRFQKVRLQYLTLYGSALLTATAPSRASGQRPAPTRGESLPSSTLGGYAQDAASNCVLHPRAAPDGAKSYTDEKLGSPPR